MCRGTIYTKIKLKEEERESQRTREFPLKGSSRCAVTPVTVRPYRVGLVARISQDNCSGICLVGLPRVRVA